MAIARLLDAPEYGMDFVCGCVVFARVAVPHGERTLLGEMVELKYSHLVYEHLQRNDDALLRKVIKYSVELAANKAPWLGELRKQIRRLGEVAQAAGLWDGGDKVRWN